MTIKTEQIIEDAQVAACFLRTLVTEGVSVEAAIQLTGSYVCSRSWTAANKITPPREPWEGDEK